MSICLHCGRYPRAGHEPDCPVINPPFTPEELEELEQLRESGAPSPAEVARETAIWPVELALEWDGIGVPIPPPLMPLSETDRLHERVANLERELAALRERLEKLERG